MRESSERRDTVFPWGDTPDTGAKPGELVPIEPEVPPFAVGNIVISVADNARGTVTRTSDVVAPLVCVLWSGDKEDVIYPANTEAFRRAWPWEVL